MDPGLPRFRSGPGVTTARASYDERRSFLHPRSAPCAREHRARRPAALARPAHVGPYPNLGGVQRRRSKSKAIRHLKYDAKGTKVLGFIATQTTVPGMAALRIPTPSRTANSAEEWVALARRKLEDAGKAERAGLRQQSYDEYGYAVEFAIKALIMRKKRLNQWPGRDTQPQLYTHSLNALMKETSCFREFSEERRKDRQLRLNWLVIKDWQPSRYRIEQPSGRVIRDMQRAASGVIEWLSRR